VPWVAISLNTTATFDVNIATYEGNKQGVNASVGSLIGVHSLSKEYVWNCSAGQSITIFMTAIQSGAGAATRILQPTLVLKYFSSRY
jgi:hypothetical protein